LIFVNKVGRVSVLYNFILVFFGINILVTNFPVVLNCNIGPLSGFV
jgi:hypothetical protein